MRVIPSFLSSGAARALAASLGQVPAPISAPLASRIGTEENGAPKLSASTKPNRSGAPY